MVRGFRPDCLFKQLVARTDDEVHRLQNVQSQDQAREAEWVAARGIFAQRQVSARTQVIIEIGFENSPQAALVEDRPAEIGLDK